MTVEVGIETDGRFLRKNVVSIQDVVDRYNGIANLFYNPYKYRDYVDYFIFDLDGPTSFEDNNKLCKYFNKFQHVHVFSGKKGFHFYLKIKPIPLNDMLRVYFMGFVNFVKDEIELGSWDYNTSIRLATGNGLIRIPNTIHLGGRYCTYIPCNVDFDTVLKYAEHTNPVLRHSGDEYDITVYSTYERKHNDVNVTVNTYEIDDVDINTVREIVRPCIFNRAYTKHPDHFIRTQFTLELIYLGYDVDSILNILSKMGWDNFDYNISRYHVQKLFDKVKSKKLLPASCSTLRNLGIGCDKCDYNNWWYE